MLKTTRTYRAKIVNHSQVSDDLDDCGHSASKLWSVVRYHSQQECDDTGEIPSPISRANEKTTNETVQRPPFSVKFVRDGSAVS
jgi:putative transposase